MALTVSTPVRLTLATVASMAVFLLGVHPWAIAQVRQVVKDEFVSAGMGSVVKESDLLKQEIVNRKEMAQTLQSVDGQLTAIKLDLQELKGEVRLLRSISGPGR